MKRRGIVVTGSERVFRQHVLAGLAALQRASWHTPSLPADNPFPAAFLELALKAAANVIDALDRMPAPPKPLPVKWITEFVDQDEESDDPDDTPLHVEHGGPVGAKR